MCLKVLSITGAPRWGGVFPTQIQVLDYSLSHPSLYLVLLLCCLIHHRALLCIVIDIMADINLQEVHDFMIDIARKVGERITSATPSTGAAGSKKNCTLRGCLC